jgi:hypothetical protein
MSEGWIMLHRQLLESHVFANQTALKIWIWCLLKASRKERFVDLKIGKGNTTVKISPGQFIFGRYKAENELNIDGSTVYRWMQKFQSKDFEMIEIQCNSQYSIVTICNWDVYQINTNESEQQMSTQRATNEQTMNTDYKVKKVNRTFVPPSLQEFSKYFIENGFSHELAERAFKGYDVAEWHDSEGKQIKNWKQKCQHVWFKPEFKVNSKPKLQQSEIKLNINPTWQ